jgi:hypothetical protein
MLASIHVDLPLLLGERRARTAGTDQGARGIGVKNL